MPRDGLKLKLSIILVASLMTAMSCVILDGDQQSPTATPPRIGEPDRSINDLALATVQILAMYREGDQYVPIWSGSGSVIDERGLILTNAHVVDDRYDEYSHLGVALIERTDQPPNLSYLAEIAAVDYGLDLAVIRIISDLSGNSVSVDLPVVELGDSDLVELGGDLRILGYPGIGGETITFTEGAISGFTSERGIDGRAWIKTDATIAGGNSGGMAVDSSGYLIGIPTQISSGDDQADIVDCRAVVDTNRDGVVDDQDTCIPIGGFINGLRPVNLAFPIIDAARAGQQYIAGGTTQPPGGFDLTDTIFYNLEFSPGVTDNDTPVNVVRVLPSGIPELCVFWEFEGMVDGMSWSAIWFIDRELSDTGSIIEDSWGGGSAGNWWACIFNDLGLDDGLYELVLEVEGERLATESIFVGGNHTPIDFTLVNQSSDPICYAYLSPSLAQNWGQDELGAQEIVFPEAVSVFPLVTGEYDILLLDCDNNTLAEEYNLQINGNMNYTHYD
ncbi:MAG TPA: trypsin-like peptidase domain-containing protein [Anaerolineae bacterium]|nr:trypsin-like peptidase domain-containing protein [Anaerolineae bacterium]